MKRRLWLGVAMAASLATSTFLVTGVGTANRSAMNCGGDPERGPADHHSEVADGRGIAALVRNRIVMVKESGEREAFRHAGQRVGVLRHSTNVSGIGSAYVNDLQGPDALVVVTPEEVRTIAEAGEVTHPALAADGTLAWVVDLQSLRVKVGDGTTQTIGGPLGTTSMFSPVFTGPQEITLVAQEPAGSQHDDGLNNLWTLDLASGNWTKLTAFSSDGDAWTVIRTPIVAGDGAVHFVVVRGIASQTAPPTYELWAIQSGTPTKLRDLPGEMFLAGISDEQLVWNVFDPPSGDWRLRADPDSRDLGCGGVMVDPRSQTDPDVLEEPEPESEREPARGSGWGVRAPVGGPANLAVLVGDFTRAEAVRVAGLIGPVFDGAEIVNHELAPGAVAPEAWAVVWRVPAGRDVQAELARLRGLFPEFAGRSWIVALQS